MTSAETEAIQDLQRKVAEHKVLIDLLFQRLDGRAPVSADTGKGEVIQALREGNPIEAVRRWRMNTGDGLVEAKAAVDELAATL